MPCRFDGNPAARSLLKCSQHSIPIDCHFGDDPERRSTFPLHDDRMSVTLTLESIDRQRLVCGLDQPDLRDTGAFVDCPFHDCVMTRRRRRENFRNPIRGVMHAALIEFIAVGYDEDVGLHDCVDLFIRFAGLRQTDIERSNIGTGGSPFQRHTNLKKQLPDDLLMESRRSRWLPNISDTVDGVPPPRPHR